MKNPLVINCTRLIMQAIKTKIDLHFSFGSQEDFFLYCVYFCDMPQRRMPVYIKQGWNLTIYGYLLTIGAPWFLSHVRTGIFPA